MLAPGNGGRKMYSNQVAALKRERDLLQEILDLAECQPELLASGRFEDLEILLSLREGPLSLLVSAEEALEPEINLKRSPATEDLQQICELNVAIMNLADRIINIDKRTERLWDRYDDYEPAERSADAD
jgi:hypothetical protein